MQLRMWSYDLAREQSPSLSVLRELCDLTLRSGYNALGLYLEHRFAYPSAPWAAGQGAIKPETVRSLIEEFPDLQIIPFVNLLGHTEGLIYTSEGTQFAEDRFKGMQSCPSNPACVNFAEKILDDVLKAFDSEIVHIGADEIMQIGSCPACAARVSDYELTHPGGDGKAMLFGSHFAPFAQKVLDAGRKPAVWGDMFVDHPTALGFLPKATIVFDWQYFSNPATTAKRFLQAGHEVVLCPTLNTYAAPWFHLPQGELNVTEHAQAAEEANSLGVCVTTWECELFGNYSTLLPALEASGKILSNPPKRTEEWANADRYQAVSTAPTFLKEYRNRSEAFGDWADLMGIKIQESGGLFAYGCIRSALKARFLLYSNPFLLWLRNRDELLGPSATEALTVLDHAISVSPDSATRGVSEFVRIAIEFVRHVEDSATAYRDGKPGVSAAALAPARAGFDDLVKIAKATHLNIGGSLADIERCRAAKEHVERVMRRIKQYGDGSLGYLPSYETICHPKFIPFDQGAWWLINDWANE
jgi:hypothetical protein